MSAAHARRSSASKVGDAVIRGYIVSMEGGGAGGFAKRFVIGIGAGTTEMDTVAEEYVMTAQGLRKLPGNLSSSENKMPGMVVPSAVAIAAGRPVGLIVVGGGKIVEAATGGTELEGRASQPPTRLRLNSRSDFRTEAGLLKTELILSASSELSNLVFCGRSDRL